MVTYMKKYAITHIDNGNFHYLVMFGYDGGNWQIHFSDGDLFCPVTLPDRHSAYSLLNFIAAYQPFLAGSLDVEEVELDG